MKTVLKSSIFKDKILVKYFNQDFEVDSFKENTIKLNNSGEIGTVREIQLNGIRIVHRNIKTSNYKINVSHDFPFFKLQFEIEGSSHYKPFNKSGVEVYIPGGYYNLFYLPEVNGELTYKTNYRKTLEILFTENYIKKIIGDDYKKDLKKFGNSIHEKRDFLMWKKSQPITDELNVHIEEIINCEYSENLKRAYLQAKINELLIFLLEKTNESHLENRNEELTKEDYNNILKVEHYIKSNLEKSLTIPKLAIIAGINTSKLKHDFKIVFSITIFKFITKLRMEKAKKLIIDGDYTVSEAAYKVGYKHSQHFTVAFKKLYGYLPSKMIKN
ncbi:AraC-like DNA-binding protein [Tenacibaculum adriaticum]|uniref:AraC-like DNA-binding protein n=1 Tax=Tenacibaculum adriaticum TaxID=413713 RepID=A0A5S5DWE8_9FLAO|nr:AraC family transcriptional regulator [Tenacibaculum adriaticum]TYQ00055.1 AraC-like DNA-binding protein [Tenacibaculum adriaticum]